MIESLPLPEDSEPGEMSTVVGITLDGEAATRRCKTIWFAKGQIAC